MPSNAVCRFEGNDDLQVTASAWRYMDRFDMSFRIKDVMFTDGLETFRWLRCIIVRHRGLYFVSCRTISASSGKSGSIFDHATGLNPL